MPLTPEEQRELQQLQAEVGGLSPEEHAEMQQLQAELDQHAAAAPQSDTSVAGKLMDTPFLQQLKGKVDQATSPQGVQQMAASYLPAGVAMRAAGPIRQAAMQGSLTAMQGDSVGERAGQGAIGGLLGGGLQAFFTGAKAIGKGIARPFQDVAAARNPARMAEQSADLVQQASQKLDTNRADEVAQMLAGRKGTIDPRQFRGLSPEADSIINEKLVGNPYGGSASKLEMDMADIDKMRRAIDSQVSYKKGLGAFQRSAEAADADARLAAKAGELRNQVKSSGADVSDLYDDWSGALAESRMLDQGSAKNPIAFLKSESPDRQALFQSVEEKTGVPLRDASKRVSTQLRLADAIGNLRPIEGAKAVGSSVAGGVGAAIGKPIINDTADTALRQALLQTAFSKKHEKKR